MKNVAAAPAASTAQMAQMMENKRRFVVALRRMSRGLSALLARQPKSRHQEVGMAIAVTETACEVDIMCACKWLGAGIDLAGGDSIARQRRLFRSCSNEQFLKNVRAIDRLAFGRRLAGDGLEEKYHGLLSDWARLNPAPWGNKFGSEIYLSAEAWGLERPVQVFHPRVIADHLSAVADRLEATPAPDVRWP